ncbi:MULTISPECIES: STAS domain-containing protein [Bacillales]|uniref:Anti-sigma factor antagonist n=1 Tax=Lysinibacillus louembei TaxID=1470088 RepID=A0ABZ0S1Q5_9BACI|nr:MULTISPECIES: STAS domain-containing protein [Bacillales]MCT6925497.1 STAS domain-containing protein [Metasolibacillus sp.]MCT6941701.1 STAS domain-containing protein [Metasolibacillus sp.]WPK13556.1 STAS domain-containing protein [Lysinibacillus louembei]
MNINVQFQKDGQVVNGYIEGEIDTYTAPILREELDALEFEKDVLIQIDLSKVSYLDSTGLGIFVAFYKKVVKENAHLKLVGLTARLIRLFEITGLSELMDIETNTKVEYNNESI